MATETHRPMPGGPLAIDLLNTTWQGSDGPVDWLDTDEAVKAFADEYGHNSKGVDLGSFRASLVQARKLARRLFDAEVSDEDLMDEVNAALESARAVVVSSNEGPTLSITGDKPHNALAIESLVNAVELRRDRADRVRCCEHDSCVLWFLDTSKGGRRRWCSMERCGNRSKAQRHYERQTKKQ